MSYYVEEIKEKSTGMKGFMVMDGLEDIAKRH